MSLIRSSLFNLWFYVGTFAIALAGIVPRWLERWVKPAWLGPDWALGFSRFWGRYVLFGLRLLAGTTWRVRGAEHLPRSGPALIVPMHQSAFDTMIWFLLVPRACYVLKQELTRIPLFGPMLTAVKMIAVDRSAGAAAIRTLLKAADRAKAEARQIVIFPEGTRVAPGQRGDLHPGFAAIASRTGLPVIPVTTNSGVFWGRRAFRKRAGVIDIEIHPPMPPGLSRQEMTLRLDALYAAASAAGGAQAAGMGAE